MLKINFKKILFYYILKYKKKSLKYNLYHVVGQYYWIDASFWWGFSNLRHPYHTHTWHVVWSILDIGAAMSIIEYFIKYFVSVIFLK
jgi:hypothetical protein